MVIIVDGNSFFYRAFHGLPPLTTKNGIPTGAIHGVINMLNKLIAKKANNLIVVFDAKGKTFRQEIFNEYKAHRPPMPTDLVSQLEPLKNIIQAMGIPVLSVQGVEADDVMGTLAKEFVKLKDEKVVLATSDKDFAQLVDENITLDNTMSNQKLDVDGVYDKFGVEPALIIDYLALVGDKVDNVPGVDGCGPKTAVKWLSEYKSLENLMANADAIKGKIGEKLRNSLEFLPVAKKLVTIKTDVGMSLSLDDLETKPIKKNELSELCENYELKSLAISMDLKKSAPKINFAYNTITKEQDFYNLLDKLNQVKVYVLDLETTSIQAINANIVGLALSFNDENYYIPINHKEDTKQLNEEFVLSHLGKIFEDDDKTIVGHNLKYDLSVLKNYSITIKNKIFDTMIASYVLNSNQGRHDLDTLALMWFEHENIKFSEIIQNYDTFDYVPIVDAAKYAAEDSFITLKLYNKFTNLFETHPWASFVCNNIDFPLVGILSSLEHYGVSIDKDYLKKQSLELSLHIQELSNKAYKIVGKEFNLLSPKQLQEILYKDMNLPVVKKTPKGQPSTSEEVLSELAKTYPLALVILQYRQFSKLKSTYTDALPLQVNPKTNRIHASFNQTVTTTGRLSSNNPNLQNIPIKTSQGRKIREAFTTKADKFILAADYSQVELRVMAHLSMEQNLIKAFQDDKDVHAQTASEVFNVTLENVTKDHRRKAKAINFGLIYGMSEFGLAKQLQLSRKEAKAYIEIYFDRYPKVKSYIEMTKKMAHDLGYVESIFGRRLYLPEINARDFQKRQAAERAAINAPVQGSAADIIKYAMINVDNNVNKKHANMIMQVHDELVFEVTKEHINEVKDQVISSMENAAKLKVNLKVDINIADSWS